MKICNQKLDSYCYYCYYWAILSFRKTKKAVGVSCHSDLKISVSNIIKTNKKMKKFLFSALACVAFAGSGFASNEVVSEITEIEMVTTSADGNSFHMNASVFTQQRSNETRPCSYTIVYTNKAGRKVTVTGNTSGNVSAVTCANVMSIEVKKLEDSGMRVHSFSSEWR